jgi:hypothetical protein
MSGKWIGVIIGASGAAVERITTDLFLKTDLFPE